MLVLFFFIIFGGDILLRERGRPKKPDAKNVRIMFRVTPDDAYKLHVISENTGLSRAEIMRKALNTQYQIHKHSN